MFFPIYLCTGKTGFAILPLFVCVVPMILLNLAYSWAAPLIYLPTDYTRHYN